MTAANLKIPKLLSRERERERERESLPPVRNCAVNRPLRHALSLNRIQDAKCSSLRPASWLPLERARPAVVVRHTLIEPPCTLNDTDSDSHSATLEDATGCCHTAAIERFRMFRSIGSIDHFYQAIRLKSLR